MTQTRMFAKRKKEKKNNKTARAQSGEEETVMNNAERLELTYGKVEVQEYRQLPEGSVLQV